MLNDLGPLFAHVRLFYISDLEVLGLGTFCHGAKNYASRQGGELRRALWHMNAPHPLFLDMNKIYKESKKVYCAYALLVRAVCESAPGLSSEHAGWAESNSNMGAAPGFGSSSASV